MKKLFPRTRKNLKEYFIELFLTAFGYGVGIGLGIELAQRFIK